MGKQVSNSEGFDNETSANHRWNIGADHHFFHGQPFKLRLLGLIFFLMLALSAGFWGGRLAFQNSQENNVMQHITVENQGELIGNIARDVGESVVSITPVHRVNNGFFGTSESESAGTGIILSEDGLIITNRHVVPAATVRVSVTLADGTVYDDVEIVGRTGTTDVLDIAFLKINDTKGKKLKAARIGDSSKMRVGDSVIAIGNALGQFQNTVTFGIISGHGRDIQAGSRNGSDVSNLENLFQTDAAINEGNSGGPLVNLNGEVIGINTAAVVSDAQGIGFAIPVNDFSGLIDSVKQTGKFERPFLGVMYIPLTADLAAYFNLKTERGAYVVSADLNQPAIIAGSPADRAGIEDGDIIIKVNDTQVDEERSLASLINRYSVGDEVMLTILRDGNKQDITVQLGAAPTE